MKTILYLSYGEGPHICEIRCSIASIWCFGAPLFSDIRVAVYTDTPASYADLPVTIREIAPSEWAKWAGPRRYRHRCKILALQQFLKETRDSVILVDGDTWWRRPPSRVLARIAPGHSVMHIREGRLDRVQDSTYHKVLEILKTSKVFMDTVDCRLPTDLYMWNAGVIGVCYEDLGILDRVLEMTDWLCKKSTDIHVWEQLAFSYFLVNETNLTEAKNDVVHYWSPAWRKAIQHHIQLIDPFEIECPPLLLAERFLKNLPRSYSVLPQAISFVLNLLRPGSSMRRNYP